MHKDLKNKILPHPQIVNLAHALGGAVQGKRSWEYEYVVGLPLRLNENHQVKFFQFTSASTRLATYYVANLWYPPRKR